MIDWSEFRSWAQLLFTIAVFVYSWVATRHRAHVSELRELSQEVSGSKERLAVVERNVSSAPARREFEELGGDLRVIAERLTGFSQQFELWRTMSREQMGRIENYLQRLDR